MSRYDEYPDHILHDVPEDILEAARKCMRDAQTWEKWDPGISEPLADSVIMAILEAGFEILPRKTRHLEIKSGKSGMGTVTSVVVRNSDGDKILTWSWARHIDGPMDLHDLSDACAHAIWEYLEYLDER